MGSSNSSIVLVSTAIQQHRMWYEYEPLLTNPGRITSTPEKVPFPFPHSYPKYASNSHSGAGVYPSYQSYLGGMLDYDYQYEGHKHGKGCDGMNVLGPNHCICITGPVHTPPSTD